MCVTSDIGYVWDFDLRNSTTVVSTTDILFRQTTTFIKICVAFVFGLQILLKSFSRTFMSFVS